ncbi:tRNA lysidine(34) synthetase TilS [Novacetimonas hansenii]|uniref:tRNA(Ile)-lysidine synthase n=2 Tax=Novacetimonas hansenii TaxID=436 RepID=A0ABQ0SCV1_NOVHA|nr:tRNA lysidine(34) synthetase TilS [Novacetimonas hansenii]EFG82912.1 tRNA(Ile)-lysidine synthetase [Novacetimonas hansenii ATCC 23769]GAN85311.1 Ile-tRNA lysidine synthase TilS [Novacetimonas hansenii JCM 7643]GEC63076.1 tRNA(Ile)-lysidine synthase [Novacetimonas hansenii]
MDDTTRMMRAQGGRVIGDAGFARCMQALGPWLPDGPDAVPVAIAVSGGADSLALALLTRRWRRAVVGLVVDHGLRAESADEAARTVRCLAEMDIPARLLRLRGLLRGPRMAERARRLRYQALCHACRELGCLDLLLGHHGDDQAETVMMRQRASSGPDGLAAMAQAVAGTDVRFVRPLLGVCKADLYATLRHAGIDWVEDPSNTDLRTERARARHALSTDAQLRRVCLQTAQQAGGRRMARDAQDAQWLAAHARFDAGGWVGLPRMLPPERVLSALVRTVSGHEYPPSPGGVAALCAVPRAATLGGACLLAHGGEWLLAREEAAMQGHVRARAGICWDGRFVLHVDGVADGAVPALSDLYVGAAGAVATWWPRERGRPPFPARVLRTLPALHRGGRVVAVPHMGVFAPGMEQGWRFAFAPPCPATMLARFTPSGQIHHPV